VSEGECDICGAEISAEARAAADACVSLRRLCGGCIAIMRVEALRRLTGDALYHVLAEVERAREMHPRATFAALVRALGDVGRALETGAPDEELRRELVHVACVAVRLLTENGRAA
jgi:hypothetical protein